MRRYPVHRSILAFDVEGFGDPHRDDLSQNAVRDVIYRVVEEAFDAAGVRWSSCVHEDRGDGAIVIVPPETSKVLLLDPLLGCLSAALAEHNRSAALAERIRLRVALHAGEVIHDGHGLAGGDVVRACRLLDAGELKTALVRSSTPLAVIVSDVIYETIVRHGYGRIDPALYHPVSVRVKKDVIPSWIHLYGSTAPPDLDPVPPVPEPRSAPHQLLPAAPVFVNRRDQLRELHDAVDHGVDGYPKLAVLVGPPGVGKTSLALRWANEVRDRFPDGELFADLGGPGRPAAVESVLAAFLRGLGVAHDRLPVERDEQSQLFRSLTSDRSVIVVLDNAASAEVVRALLPASASSVVVVTSGTWLGGLVMDGAVFVEVGPLTERHSLELLERSAGGSRIAAEAGAARQLVALCGGLPIALSVTGARLAMRPRWTVGRVVSDLVDERRRLARLSLGADFSVQAVFDVSYQALSPSAARLYRLLGLHPGADFDARLAAAVLGVPLLEGETLVDELLGANLLEERDADRYRFHDLIRLHARQQAEAVESEDDLAVARRRILDWYLHAATLAGTVVTPHRHDLRRDIRYRPVEPVSFAGHTEALDWLEQERGNLYAAASHAADLGQTGTAWQLADAMWGLFLFRSYYQDWLRFDLLAVRVTGDGDDPAAEAEANDRIGLLYNAIGRNDEALAHMGRAAELWTRLGDRHRIAGSRERFGFAYLDQGRTDLAVEHFTAALADYESLGERRSSGLALVSIGRALTTANRFEEAKRTLGRASAVLGTLPVPDPYNHARAMLAWARAETEVGELNQARTRLEEALATMRAVNSPLGQADVLKALGMVYERAADPEAARRCYRRCLDILVTLDNPDADAIQRRLDALTSGAD